MASINLRHSLGTTRSLNHAQVLEQPPAAYKKSPPHMIRNAYPLRHNQVHQPGELLQPGFVFPYMGPYVTWLLIRLQAMLNVCLTQLFCGPW